MRLLICSSSSRWPLNSYRYRDLPLFTMAFQTPKMHIVDWGRKWLASLNTGFCNCSNNSTLIYVRIDGIAQGEKSYFKILAKTYSGCLGDQYRGLGTQRTLFKFSFFSCISTLNMLSGNEWFYNASIISKWLRRQKCKQKGKAMRQRDIKDIKETVYKIIFIHL